MFKTFERPKFNPGPPAIEATGGAGGFHPFAVAAKERGPEVTGHQSRLFLANQ